MFINAVFIKIKKIKRERENQNVNLFLESLVDAASCRKFMRPNYYANLNQLVCFGISYANQT